MRGFEKLQTAVFGEWDVSACKLDLKFGAMVGSTEQDCLVLKIDAGFAVLQDAIDHVFDLR